MVRRSSSLSVLHLYTSYTHFHWNLLIKVFQSIKSATKNMVANVILVFFYYAIAAIIPFLLFSCLSSACRDKGGPTRSLTIMLCQYISKFPLIICLYHLLLTIGLAAFCVQEVQENMSVAVDLNYYTKTSIRATEVRYYA